MLKICLMLFVPLILIGSIGYHLQATKGLETEILEVGLGILVIILNLRRYSK